MSNDKLENDQVDSESSDQEHNVDQARRNLTRAGFAVPVLMSFSGYSPLANACMSPSRIFSGNASPQAGDTAPCAGRSPGYWKVCQWFKEWNSPYGTENPAVYSATTQTTEQKKGTGTSTTTTTTTTWAEQTTGGPANYSEFEAEKRAMLHYGPEFSYLCSGGAQIPPLSKLYQLPATLNLTNAQLIKPRTYGLSMWELLAFPADIVANNTGMSMETVQLARHLVAAHLNIHHPTYGLGYPLTDAILSDMWQAASNGGEYFPNGSNGTPGNGWAARDIVCYIRSTFDPGAPGFNENIGFSCT
ncbi:hypothetical protein [Methylocaldum sp.]|uniref:hypothetical protein n=1 Tax=Methylocaldum sp. TaxID=1969727 RepID=UPI002D27D3CD|nr:hypothetical protein [Methylocaldum sp.]HYE37637.1 hypothetical protein [Methylocaldum sp.]